MNVDETRSASPDNADDTPDEQEGPGWMPAILAATLLMGIVGFVACGFTTWLLFQKRSELALRTIEASYLPEIEQSRLQPEEKADVVAQLEAFAKELERGEHENWQAAAVMQRLVRLPVIQWGHLRVVESFLQNDDQDASGDALKQLSRLRRAIQLGGVTSLDVEDVLKPLFVPDDSTYGRSLADPLTRPAVEDTVNRAKLLADRSDVPDTMFENIRLADIVKKEIDTGLSQGGY